MELLFDRQVFLFTSRMCSMIDPSRMCSMTDLSTPQRSSVDQAKMSLLSCRNCMTSLLVLLSSLVEMMTYLLVLPLNNGTFLVSSIGFALAYCSRLSSEGSLAFGFSLSRLCTFFCPRVAISSAILERS